MNRLTMSLAIVDGWVYQSIVPTILLLPYRVVHLPRYLGLLALQLVPSLLVGMNYAPFVYFGVLAVSTVYLGAKRQDIPDVSITLHGIVYH